MVKFLFDRGQSIACTRSRRRLVEMMVVMIREILLPHLVVLYRTVYQYQYS